MKYILLATTFALVIPLGAAAKDFPKSGEAEYTNYITARPIESIHSGDSGGGLTEVNGVSRSATPGGPFDNMTIRCLENYTKVDGKQHGVGSCVLTDTDGDTIFQTFEAYPPSAHNFNYVSGTGKYKGIEGHGTYTVTILHELAGGGLGVVIPHKVSWEIK